MTQGVVMFDTSERLVTCNRRYIEMYGLSPDVIKRGVTLAELIKHRSDKGTLAIDIEKYRQEILNSVKDGKSSGRRAHEGNRRFRVGGGRFDRAAK